MRRLAWVLVVLSSCAVLACDAEKNQKPASDATTQVPPAASQAAPADGDGAKANAAPEDFSISVTREGGIAGRSEGLRLERDGALVRVDCCINGHSPGERVGNVPPSVRDALYREVIAAHFFEQTGQPPRCCDFVADVVRVTAGGKSHVVSFNQAPAELTALLKAFEEATRAPGAPR